MTKILLLNLVKKRFVVGRARGIVKINGEYYKISPEAFDKLVQMCIGFISWELDIFKVHVDLKNLHISKEMHYNTIWP
ncbi:MAG: hypothetical protein VZR56_11995 [Treponema sp.]|nr:hypothetical protein [Treponema sp.]